MQTYIYTYVATNYVCETCNLRACVGPLTLNSTYTYVDWDVTFDSSVYT